ncbi:Lsr2 family DNA-binding protein [Rhodococcus opacus]|uniref:Lsr2 family DNA-binding protein n=1 Tax=Rhodococcus opacus TaxID=37919 RepID=UPI001C492356|nr:histone-like nucleoid-structuring protein Lsr2 [Rhodococcus opacus]MBV6762760.1 Lsr2 family protein [Rhodococcus opacus]
MAISPRGSDSSAKKTTKEIREWAIGEGREVSLRGRISAEIEQAFYDAQPKKVQAKAAPVKKVAEKNAAAKKAAVRNTAAATAQAKKAQAVSAPATNTAVTNTAVKKTAVKKAAVKKPVAAKVPMAGEVVSKASAKKSSREIREWALGAGHEVSSRGRVPAEIQQAFHEAQAKQVQAKAAPVKKTAATKAVEKKTAEKKRVGEKSAGKKIVSAKVSVTKEVVSKAPAERTSREIREWATGAGHEVSSRGRIPAEIQRAFRDAQVEMPVA